MKRARSLIWPSIVFVIVLLTTWAFAAILDIDTWKATPLTALSWYLVGMGIVKIVERRQERKQRKSTPPK